MNEYYVPDSKRQILMGVLLALVGIACVVAMLWYLVVKYFEGGELGEKKFYGLLQSIEDTHRKDGSSDPLLLKDVDRSGLDVLGVPSGDATYPRVWFVLNQLSPAGGVLRMPSNLNLKVACRDLEGLTRGAAVQSKVKDELSRECTR